MGIVYKTEKKTGIIITTLSGLVTTQEYLAHPQNLINDPNIKKPFLEIFDTRQVTELGIDIDEVKSMSRQIHEISRQMKGSKIAMIAGSDLTFGFGRMFQSLSESAGIEVLVTRDYEEGKKFLLNSA